MTVLPQGPNTDGRHEGMTRISLGDCRVTGALARLAIGLACFVLALTVSLVTLKSEIPASVNIVVGCD
jgi:hypothetical protein